MTPATIIKLDFALNNLMHSALVSMCGDAKDSFIHIQLLHSFFKKVFGVEHIRFRNFNGKIQLEDIKYPFVRQIALLINTKLNEQIQHPFPSHQLRAI